MSLLASLNTSSHSGFQCCFLSPFCVDSPSLKVSKPSILRRLHFGRDAIWSTYSSATRFFIFLCESHPHSICSSNAHTIQHVCHVSYKPSSMDNRTGRHRSFFYCQLLNILIFPANPLGNTHRLFRRSILCSRQSDNLECPRSEQRVGRCQTVVTEGWRLRRWHGDKPYHHTRGRHPDRVRDAPASFAARRSMKWASRLDIETVIVNCILTYICT